MIFHISYYGLKLDLIYFSKIKKNQFVKNIMSGRDRDKYHSHPSGYQKRLKKQEKEEFLKKQKENFFQYLNKNPSIATNKTTFITTNIVTTNSVTSTITTTTFADNSTITADNVTSTTTTQVELTPNINDKETLYKEISQPLKDRNNSVEDRVQDTTLLKDNKIEKYVLFSNNDELVVSSKKKEIDIKDPATWSADKITQQVKYEIVKYGPSREKDIVYPLQLVDDSERKFSNNYYYKKLSNGEIVNRKWLIYSVSIDKVFCFCCKLFQIPTQI